MSVANIKNAIKGHLDALKTAGTLATVSSSEIKQHPLAGEIGPYPHAFLMPPMIESEVLDNRSVLRTYTFDIMILVKGEDISSTTEVEEIMESVLNRFDNDPTLGGTATGGMLPVSSAMQPFDHNGKDLIMIMIPIVAKDDVALTFTT